MPRGNRQDRYPAAVPQGSGTVPLPSLPLPLPLYANGAHFQPNFFNQQASYAHAAAEAGRRTFEEVKEARPENTNLAYNGRQKEFLFWCARRCPPDHTNQIVDDAKLHLFLVEEVALLLTFCA